MKKTTIVSVTVLFIIGMALGMTLSFTEQAHAKWLCTSECLYEIRCKDGPDCDPDEQAYYYAFCIGGPYNCPNDHWLPFCCRNIN